uniref:Uncharacterized protein AlNc14C10G1252 n=1 Tax=Albugo laibachii Nc14 TaxID=890382 RepID=F0W2K5_9STRA|nr:hypothetical protein PITG_05510 [Albugo laibachii Nc14]|eukprot:CCA15291.1 hypothetical protein PITG_05510 [Albugo laibachii Nc14]
MQSTANKNMDREERRKRYLMRESKRVNHISLASSQGQAQRKSVPSASFSSSSSTGYIERKGIMMGKWKSYKTDPFTSERSTQRIVDGGTEIDGKNDARLGQNSKECVRSERHSRQHSLDTTEDHGRDEFTELIPSIDCMNLAVDFGRERLVEKKHHSKKELGISFQDASSFLKKQEEEEFLAELPPPSTTSTDPPSSEWVERGHNNPCFDASFIGNKRDTLESGKLSLSRGGEETYFLQESAVSAGKLQKRNTQSHHKELHGFDSDQSLAGAQKYTSEARAFTACVTNRVQDTLNIAGSQSTQEDYSVIEVIKRGPPGIKVALGELNGLLSYNPKHDACDMKRRDNEGQHNMKSDVRNQGRHNVHEYEAGAVFYQPPSDQLEADRFPLSSDYTQMRRWQSAEHQRNMPTRDMKEISRKRDHQNKNKSTVRIGHFASSQTELDVGDISSSSGWTEKFFGLSFSSNASCLAEDELGPRHESDVFKGANDPYSADTTTTIRSKTRFAKKMNSIAENAEDDSMGCLQTKSQRSKSNICARARNVDSPTKRLHLNTDGERNEFMKLDVKRKHCKQQSSRVHLPRYEDIQPQSAFMQDSRYCRRLLCSIGDSIKENISFTNRSNSTARICFSLLPLSIGCHQYTVSPAVLDIPAGARRDFSLEFRATCAGVSAGILQFRGIDANTLFAPYEVLIEACVKESKKVFKESFHEQNVKPMEKPCRDDSSAINDEKPTQIEELKEDEEEKELLEISPTFIRFNAKAINGETIIPEGNITISNRSNSSIPFKISCNHENIQITPKQGVVESKCDISISVSPISRPFLKSSRRRSMGIEKNNEQKTIEGKDPADVWYGSFTLQVGTSLSREISIVLEPSALEILPNFDDTARRRHGLRNQTDSFYYTRKMNRQGLYFHARAVECGNCPIAESHQVPVYICNGSNNPMTVFLQELSPPFYCNYSTTTIQPRKFIEVPVSFTPKVKGKVSTSLHAYSLADKASVTLIARGV